MQIGYGSNFVNRLIVGFLSIALLLSSFGSLNLVKAEEQNTSSTDNSAPTSTIIDNTTTQNSTSTTNSSSTTGTQNGSSTSSASTTPQASTTLLSNVPTTPEVEDPGETITDTGNAGAFSNVLNVVNTNIIDSQTLFAFLNYINGIEGDITLPWSEEGLSRCNNGCFEGGINIENNNEADVNNDISVTASTGNNNINGNNRSSTIITGHAAAAANIANLVNTNIINSNYLLLAINSFNSFNGSLILPPSSFFNSQNGGVTTPRLSIENNNGADIINNVSTTASTGNNEITGGGSGVIATGNSGAMSNVTNIVNSNFVNRDRMFIMVRVTGDWAGNVFSPPPGLSWRQTPGGIILYSEGLEDEIGGGGPCCEGSANISNNNGASVTNNVEVYALTGDNKIEGEGDGLIATGHAAAAANVFNMVNSNVIGRNWMFGMINIFGDWNGNLSFGQPDLWVGARAEVVSDPSTTGDYITYIIDVINRGNADATQVKIKSASQAPQFFTPMNFSSGGGVSSDRSVTWSLPKIPAGGSVSFRYLAKVGDNLPSGTTLVENKISVEAYEPESINNNNLESLSIALVGNPITTRRAGGAGAGSAKLTLNKTNNTASTISPSSTVTYSLLLKNEGNGSAFDTIISDTLRDPYGRVISRNSWDLGVVYPGEKINIDYDIHYSDLAKTGYYINYASVAATDDYYYSITNLPRASSSVYIVNPKDAPVAPPTIIQVGGGSGGSGGGITTSTEEDASQDIKSGGSTPVSPIKPAPPQPPAGVSEDDLFDSAGEELIQGSGVQFIESFEPIREVDENHESLLQATTSFLRSKLLASFSFLPSGAWAFFLLLLLLIAIVGRSLLNEDRA